MDKKNEGPKVICKYCGYKIDKDTIKEHEEKYCDQNPKATNPVKGDKIKEMKGKNKSFYLWRNMFVFMVFIFLIGWWLITPTEDDNIYPGDVTEVKEYIKNTKIDQFSNIKEMHWDHMPLTYNYEKECGERMGGILEENIKDAITFIELKTEKVISFEKVESEEPDIMFVCSILKGTLTIAEANSSIDSQNILIPGKIFIYQADECSKENPNTIIHEILHMFGLGHKLKAYTWDIMRTFQYEKDDCNKDIAEEDIICLKYIYSNGELGGNCSNTIFIDFLDDGCPKGYYPTIEGEYCCPEPNMIIDEEGYCAVGQEIV